MATTPMQQQALQEDPVRAAGTRTQTRCAGSGERTGGPPAPTGTGQRTTARAEAGHRHDRACPRRPRTRG